MEINILDNIIIVCLVLAFIPIGALLLLIRKRRLRKKYSLQPIKGEMERLFLAGAIKTK